MGKELGVRIKKGLWQGFSWGRLVKSEGKSDGERREREGGRREEDGERREGDGERREKIA